MNNNINLSFFFIFLFQLLILIKKTTQKGLVIDIYDNSVSCVGSPVGHGYIVVDYCSETISALFLMIWSRKRRDMNDIEQMGYGKIVLEDGWYKFGLYTTQEDCEQGINGVGDKIEMFQDSGCDGSGTYWSGGHIRVKQVKRLNDWSVTIGPSDYNEVYFEGTSCSGIVLLVMTYTDDGCTSPEDNYSCYDSQDLWTYGFSGTGTCGSRGWIGGKDPPNNNEALGLGLGLGLGIGIPSVIICVILVVVIILVIVCVVKRNQQGTEKTTKGDTVIAGNVVSGGTPPIIMGTTPVGQNGVITGDVVVGTTPVIVNPTPNYEIIGGQDVVIVGGNQIQQNLNSELKVVVLQ